MARAAARSFPCNSVCMHYVLMEVLTHMSMHVYMHLRMNICMFLSICVRVCAYVFECLTVYNVWEATCMYTYTDTRVCSHSNSSEQI